MRRMMTFLAVVQGLPYPDGIVRVTGIPHGIKNGWFNFPLDFDPTWLESCDGYKEAS